MAVVQVPNRRWIVVRVWRGLVVEAEAYHQEPLARERERALRKAIKPEDELALFELDLTKDGSLAEA